MSEEEPPVSQEPPVLPESKQGPKQEPEPKKKNPARVAAGIKLSKISVKAKRDKLRREIESEMGKDRLVFGMKLFSILAVLLVAVFVFYRVRGSPGSPPTVRLPTVVELPAAPSSREETPEKPPKPPRTTKTLKDSL